MKKLILILAVLGAVAGCASPRMDTTETSAMNPAWDTSNAHGRDLSNTGRAVYGGPGN